MILQDQEDFLKKECWHMQMAKDHILKCVNEKFGTYLAIKNEKSRTSGKLIMDRVNTAKLCGLSVQAIENVFEQIGNSAGIGNAIESMTDYDIARLLQV
jgi:hypothetical protein